MGFLECRQRGSSFQCGFWDFRSLFRDNRPECTYQCGSPCRQGLIDRVQTMWLMLLSPIFISMLFSIWGVCLSYYLNANKKHSGPLFIGLKLKKGDLFLRFCYFCWRSGQLALSKHNVGTIFSEWKTIPTGTKSEVLFSFRQYNKLLENFLSTTGLFKLAVKMWLLWVVAHRKVNNGRIFEEKYKAWAGKWER